MKNIPFVALTITSFFVSFSLAAQEAKFDINDYLESKKFREINDNLLVPSSPAFAILGVSPDNVIRPTNPKEFGTALLNGVDSTGTLQTGFAMEFSPHILWSGGDLSLAEYRDNTWRRVLAQTQISLATSKAASDGDKTVRVAAGFRAVLFDNGDTRWNDEIAKYAREKLPQLGVEALDVVAPIYQLENCKIKAESYQKLGPYLVDVSRNDCPELPLDFVASVNPNTNLDETVTAQINGKWETGILRSLLISLLPTEEEIESKFDNDAKVALEAKRVQFDDAWTEKIDQFKKDAWNASNVTVGMAVTAASETGDYGDLGDAGFAFYATGAYGFEDFKGSGLDNNAHFITHARYQTNQLVTAVEDGMMPYKQDLLTLGSQLRIRGPEIGSGNAARTLVFFGEFDYKRAEPDNMPKDSSYTYAAGLDIALTDRVHFQVSVGEEDGSKMQRDAAFILGDLKWSF